MMGKGDSANYDWNEELKNVMCISHEVDITHQTSDNCV